MPAAAVLHRRAVQRMNDGDYDAANELLDEASGQTDDIDLVARIDLTRAYVRAQKGDLRGGFASCRALLQRPGLSSETQGLIWSQLALMHKYQGDHRAALADYTAAVGLLAGSDELSRALLNRASLHLLRGDASQAVHDLTTAVEMLHDDDARERRARAEHNLGYARLLTGDLVGALQAMDAARPVLAPLSPVSRAVGEQDRAEVLTAAGRAHEAIVALENAAAAYGDRGLRRYQAECELALSRTLLREDASRAAVVAKRAARRFRGQGGEVQALRADAVVVMAEIAEGKASLSVLRRADRLVAGLRAHQHRRDAAILQLLTARLAVVRGDLDDARRRIAGVRVTEDSPVATRLLWREVRSELAAARGDRRRARQHVQAGLADLHAWQSSFGSLDLQSTLVGHGRALAMQGLHLALDEGNPALAYEWSERARALVSRVTPVRPPSDAALASELTELRVLYAADPEPRSTDGRRLDQLRDHIREQSWYGDGGGRVGEPAALDEVQAELGSTDSCLVAHVVVDDKVTAVVVTGSDVRTVSLCPAGPVRADLDRIAADLDIAASHLAGPFAAAIRGSLDERVQLVSELLVAPLLPLIGERRVVLTPSAQLSGTPWTLLPGLVGRPITVPPSATRWLELRRTRRRRKPRVGLVAGPAVERAEEEVTRAAAVWPGATVLAGDRAAAARVASLAARVDLLHLAGHGRHPGDNPLFAAVDLADGPWFGYDIDQLPHTPDLVVLSSCELGRASVRSGDEVVGMTAAWLHAGARCVTSSPTLVADDVACEVLAGWHARLAKGDAPADALADAVADLDHDSAPSPFVTFGAGW
ncbi:CHAT domain-containing protein [Nocardioides agariphilus]|uniref:CHAT domain-containing protein n=1 Tax=Nocardioides agariphilus TaxID=433664 RepID=A0A930VNB0_9ACTN|nr:CHAT domain-containing protein [Nocardioides agariphilus]